MNVQQLAEAYSSKYFLDPEYAVQMSAIAFLVRKKILKTKDFGIEKEMKRPYIYEAVNRNNASQKGKVSVLTMNGPLFREDAFCGPAGTVTMSRWLKEFDADPAISAHVIDMHTPGGQVAGTEIMAQAVLNTEKPVILFGEDVLSGGYYIAAGASHIMLSGNNARVGSIGVQVSYASFKEAFEKMGIKEVTIRATSSPDKNKFDFDNLSEKDKKRYAKEELDPIDENFMNHVRENRSQVKDDSLTGNVYFADDAIKRGLADSKGTFEDAIALALEMAGVFSDDQNSNKTMKNKELTPVNVEVSSKADLEKIASLEKKLSTKSKKLKKALAQNVELSAKVETLEGKLAKSKARVKKLSKLPSAEPGIETQAPQGDLSQDKGKGYKNTPKEVLQAYERGKARASMASEE